MVHRKYYQKIYTVLILGLLIAGCTTSSSEEYGTVIEKQMVSLGEPKTNYIKKRASQAGLIGATSGATIGGLFGTFGASIAPHASLLGWGLAFGTGGAIIAGGTAAIIGGSYGLAEYALTPTKKNVWQYKVKQLNQPQTYIIKQKAPEIPLYSKVKIIKKSNSYMIKT